LEWFVYRLRSLALFDLLELAGRATVLVVAIFWFLEAGDRAKERHYRAWDLINSARGSTGDGGRRDALQDLNKDGVSLAAAPLEQAYLPGVDLTRAFLERADLTDAHLTDAHLTDAHLTDAHLTDAHLTSADLTLAHLTGAVLTGVNLTYADLAGANLTGGLLKDANLKDANLKDANLKDVNLKVTQKQLDEAIGNDRTQLPAGLTRPAHWPKPKENEGPTAAQPEHTGHAPAAGDAPGSDK
jgi:hypothetical protein